MHLQKFLLSVGMLIILCIDLHAVHFNILPNININSPPLVVPNNFEKKKYKQEHNISNKLFKRLSSGSQCSTVPVAMTQHFRCMPRYIQFDREVAHITGPASLSLPCLNEHVLLIREEKF